ncbi:MAG: extracellular solute-binding protein [Anaeroplasmataceae bacterium]|nr:extracellular solute-binding protein [Anaeroplasmataceae bacterium]
MKKLFALGAVSLLALGLASCGEDAGDDAQGTIGGGEGQTVELEYSGTASNRDFNMELFEDFKKARKDAGDKNTYVITYAEHGPDKVDSEVQDWSIGPDVFEFASDKITGLYQKGALARLTPTQTKWVRDNNNELGYDLASFNGATYAYPYTGDNTYYFQYDKSVITNPEDAKSVEKILEIAKTNGLKFGYNLKEAFWGGAAMFTFGADYTMSFDDDGSVKNIEATFDGDAGVKAAKAIKMIMEHPSWSNDMAAPTVDNKFIGCIAGTWDISTYKTALGDNYACAPMPTVTIDGETKNLGAFLGGKLFGVNPSRAGSDTVRLKAAHELAKFLSGKECQLKRFDAQNVAPCNKEAAAESRVVNDVNVKCLVEQAAFAHAQTAVPDQFWNAPATLTTAFADGTITTDAQLLAAVQSFNTSVKNAQ